MTPLFKNADDLFDKLMSGITLAPHKAREIAATYHFKIQGAGGGEWTVDCCANPPTCVKGDTDKAQCRVEVASDDFLKMLADPNLGMQLYFQGKLRVSGDPMLAMKLQHLFALAVAK